MCPPGVDQTTRSRQEWHILSPLAKRRHSITEDCTDAHRDCSLANFLNGDFTWDAFDKLAVRSTADFANVEALLSRLSRTSDNHRAAPLEELPNEILAMIFHNEDLDASDILALGLCSKALWQHCLNRAGAAVAKGPWANVPLICTGTYLDDLPPTIHEIVPSLQAEEESWRVRQSLPGRGARGMCPARRWNWNAISTHDDILDNNMETWLQSFDCAAYNRKNGVSTAGRKILRQSLGRTLGYRFRCDRRWTLRNHTTQEYAQLLSAPHSGAEHQFHVKGAPSLSLDKTLLMRICWTSLDMFRSPKPAMGKILRGQWAGHRFDVVREDQAPGEGWSDVTEEMVQEWREWRRQTIGTR